MAEIGKRKAKPAQIGDFLAEAEVCLSLFPPDEQMALTLLEQAVVTFPDHVQPLSALAELLCTAEHPLVRNEVRAIELFKKSMQLDQTVNPERYFYLGQLLATQPDTVKEAEMSYRMGINLFEAELEIAKKDGDPDRHIQMKHQISNACCALAELYMTDLCDENRAEEYVVECLNRAIRLDSNNFDAYTGLTTYLKTIGNIEEAGEVADQAMTIFKRAKGETGEFENQEHSLSEVDTELYEMPSWNSRLSLAATLVDLKRSEAALKILESLIEENDQDIQVWHVLACNHFASGDAESAEECIEIAKQLLEKATTQTNIPENAVSENNKYIEHWTRVVITTEEQIKKLASEQHEQ